jgi:hypothetical protein
MDDSFAVGVTNSVGDLTQHVQPVLAAELVAMRGQVVIETHRLGIEVSEQQDWTEFMFLVVQHGQNVRMVERLHDLEFTCRRPLPPLPVLFRFGLGHRVLANSAVDVVECSVFGQSVLVARSIGQKFAQHVVTDST